jgi:hypothetical protein
LGRKKLVYFRNGYAYKHEKLENIKETDGVFVGNIDCNMSAASDAVFAVERNFLSAVGLNKMSESHSNLLLATSTYGDM